MPPFDPFVALTQALISTLLTGPGTLPTLIAAGSYAAMAAQLHASAASVEGSMTQMGETWQASSSDLAQAAFRLQSNWLHQQGEVAAKTAAQLNLAAGAYGNAQLGMLGVQATLAAFETQQTLLAAGGPTTAPLMLLTEGESAAIFGSAIGVMANYQGALDTVIAGFPAPAVPQPIVTNPGGGPVETQALFNSPSIGPTPTTSSVGGGQSVASNAGSTAANTAGNQAGSTAANSATEAGQAATQPVSDVGQAASTMPDSPAGQGPAGNGGAAGNGAGDGNGGYLQEHGFSGIAPFSTTLAGLNGGMGSAVVLGMTRGGLGTMAGSATGFRMPANWSARGVRAFGAADADAEAEPQPVAGRAAPKSASAPETQLRRRDRDKTKSARVIVPGDDQEVPVLEQASAVGVLEYADDDFGPDPIGEQSLSVGVLERVDEDTIPAGIERSR